MGASVVVVDVEVIVGESVVVGASVVVARTSTSSVNLISMFPKLEEVVVVGGTPALVHGKFS